MISVFNLRLCVRNEQPDEERFPGYDAPLSRGARGKELPPENKAEKAGI